MAARSHVHVLQTTLAPHCLPQRVCLEPHHVAARAQSPPRSFSAMAILQFTRQWANEVPSLNLSTRLNQAALGGKQENTDP